MVQGRQRAQPQSNATQQSTRQPRPAGRASPQQSLKRVGPAISEMLRTSVRARPRNEASIESKGQAFRPDSAADAFLYLDKRVEPDLRNDVRGPDSRTQRQEVIDSRHSSTSTTRIVLPIGGYPNGRQTPSSREVTTEKRTATKPTPIRQGRPPRGPTSEEPGARRRDTMRIRLPGLLQRQFSNGRGPRLLKALPSLPAKNSSPRKASFNRARRPSTNASQNNKEKALRGRDSPAIAAVSAPRMESIPGNSKSSSGSSYDSAEQTWNMIDNMMRAVGEDEVNRARAALVPSDARRGAESVRAAGGYVTFPRVGRTRQGRDGSSEDYSSPERSGGGPSSRPRTERSRGQDPGRPARPFSRPRSAVLSLGRRASVASVFSIVIQPTRERSQDAQDALVVEDDLPLRIRGILQCTHGKFEAALSSRSSSMSSGDAELHPDLALTIGALRGVSDVELEDVVFDLKDL